MPAQKGRRGVPGGGGQGEEDARQRVSTLLRLREEGIIHRERREGRV